VTYYRVLRIPNPQAKESKDGTSTHKFLAECQGVKRMYTTKQPEERIAKLIETYPALNIIIKWTQDIQIDNVTPSLSIQVKKADENLMMFRGEYIDGIRMSLIGENGTVGTKRQEAFFVNSKDNIIDMISWSKDVSSRIKDEIGSGKIISEDDLKYLILTTTYNYYQEIEDWYEKGLENQMGKRISKKIKIQIYLPPKIGFTKLLKKTDSMENIRLHMNDIIKSQILSDPIYDNVLIEINKLIKKFENDVYLNGLKDIIDKSTMKGMSGNFGSVKLNSFVMAGRIMFTFEKEKDDITFLCAENEIPSRMGFHSINATWPTAKSIIKEVIENWENSTTPLGNRMKDDKNLGI